MPVIFVLLRDQVTGLFSLPVLHLCEVLITQLVPAASRLVPPGGNRGLDTKSLTFPEVSSSS